MEKKQRFPGSIFCRKGTNKLYIRYKKKQIAIKLDDTPQNRKIAEKILEKIYLTDNGYIQHPAKTSAHTIAIVWNEFVKAKFSQLSKTTTRNYIVAYNRIVTDDSIDCTVENIVLLLERFKKDPSQIPGYGHTSEVKKSINATSYNTYLRMFSVFTTWAFKKKHLSEQIDINDNYKRKDAVPKVIKTFSTDDIHRVLHYWFQHDKEMYLLIRFLWLTGSRITEALRLTWDNITNDLISFRNKINRDKSNLFPVTPQLREVLGELKSMNRIKVFSWQESSSSRLRRRFQSSLTLLNIDFKAGDGFHVFRKTFATELFENDLPLSEIKELMRHSSIQTTFEHYKEHRTKKLSHSLEKIHDVFDRTKEEEVHIP